MWDLDVFAGSGAGCRNLFSGLIFASSIESPKGPNASMFPSFCLCVELAQRGLMFFCVSLLISSYVLRAAPAHVFLTPNMSAKLEKNSIFKRETQNLPTGAAMGRVRPPPSGPPRPRAHPASPPRANSPPGPPPLHAANASAAHSLAHKLYCKCSTLQSWLSYLAGKSPARPPAHSRPRDLFCSIRSAPCTASSPIHVLLADYESMCGRSMRKHWTMAIR